jgi:glycosyltransferase involved in cell wall biosynthesis
VAETPAKVLFLSTRSQLGADVAMHLQLARYLPPTTHVTFAINSRAPDAKRIENILTSASRVDIVRYPLGSSMSKRSTGWIRSVMDNAGSLWGVVRVAAMVRRRRIDVIHSTDRPRDAFWCALLGMITGRSSVIHMHNNYWKEMSALSKWGLMHCSAVVGVSDHSTASLTHLGIPPERCVTVRNAIDTEYFTRCVRSSNSLRSELAIPEGAPLIGLVGRFIRPKGHEDLLQAVAGHSDLSDAHILFVGAQDGDTESYVAELHMWAALLGIGNRVHFAAFRDPRPIYECIDVLAVPSWEEPFGLVVAEALSMQVPVVAYRSGGIPEIIRSEIEGLLVSPRSVRGLSLALVRLLNDSEARERMGKAGRRRVLECFTADRQAQEMAREYRRLICQRREGRRFGRVNTRTEGA